MRKPSKASNYIVNIEKLVYQGYGLGTIDGYKVFVPNTIPGDQVELYLTQTKRSYGIAKVKTFLKRSSNRTDSPCSHFPDCGGCQIIDTAYDIQLQLKQSIIEDARQQFLPDLTTPICPVIGSKETIYYRNKMEFSFTKKDKKIQCGLKRRGKFDEVIHTSNCLLQDKNTNLIKAVAENFLSQKNVTVWNHKTHEGLCRYLVIRQSKTTQTFMVILVLSETKSDLAADFFKQLKENVPQVSSMYLGVSSEISDTAHTAKLTLIDGTPQLRETLGNLTYSISPESFFQTNTHQAETLYNHIIKLAGIKPTDTVLDLYCGTGSISLYAAQHAKHVIGIEENPQAIEDAKKNAAANNISNTEFHTGRVKNLLKFNQYNTDIIILDPPRSGTVPKALKRIIEQNAPTVIYVSCNPTTLFRDLVEFDKAGYQIETIQPIDMFPNTFHCECIVKLTQSPCT